MRQHVDMATSTLQVLERTLPNTYYSMYEAG